MERHQVTLNKAGTISIIEYYHKENLYLKNEYIWKLKQFVNI